MLGGSPRHHGGASHTLCAEHKREEQKTKLHFFLSNRRGGTKRLAPAHTAQQAASSSHSTLLRDGTIGHNGPHLLLLRVLSARAGLREALALPLAYCHTLPHPLHPLPWDNVPILTTGSELF